MNHRPKRPTRAALAAAVALALPSLASATVPAFSGADGAGSAATGGSGGIVYHVTRLDTKVSDNAVGTLQYGINDSNFTNPDGSVTPRTIVFDVGGTIWLGRNTTDVEGWDTTNSISVGSNVTIAGQTAPGGITLAGGQLKINGNRVVNPVLPLANVIVRNLTLAPGYGERKINSTSGYYDNYTYDAMDVNSSQVMIDHVSAVFATDETISANQSANNTTIQYTSMSQGQNYPQADAQGNGDYVGHAMGSLWGTGSNAKTSFLHDLYANQGTRLPAIQTVASELTNNVPGYTDFRNNVVYNWFGNAGYGSSGEPGEGNFINNYYKVGPGGDSTSGNNTDFGIKQAAGGTTVFSGSSSTQIYQNGGNLRCNLNGTTTTLTNSNFGSSVFLTSAAGSVPYAGVTDSATTAYSQVLNYVGSNWQNRDEIDSRIVNEVRTGTGKITALDDASNGYNSAGVYNTNTTNTEWNDLLALRSTTNGGTGATGSYTRAANYDTDGDGMPDIWETAMGLNPAVADNNGSVENNGYTNLDNFLDELGAFPASAPIVFGNGNGTGRYAEIGNWLTGVFEPSRYDQAQINSGTVTVDVVGQHAGTLEIATNSGNAATLAITAGWIDIAQSLLVGPAGAGVVNQTGGTLHAGTSVVIGGTNNAGTYTLSAGTLSTPLLTKGTMGGVFSFLGGTLHATTVAFSLTNQGGILAPGSDAQLEQIAAASMPDINDNTEAVGSNIGSTHIMGNLTLSSGTLQIELASPSSYDSLAIDNTLTLGATLDVEPLNGYVPHFGDSFKIATAANITGSFASIPRGYTTQITGGNLFLNSQLAEWGINGDGNSSLSSNWIGGVPGTAGGGTDAGFLGAISSPHTITVNGNYTLATMTFSNANAYTLASDNVLGDGITLDGGSLIGEINVNLGVAHAINAPLTINSNSSINTAANTSLTIGGPLTTSPGKTITKTGPGTLTLSTPESITAGAASVLAATAGTLTINTDPSPNLALTADGSGTAVNFSASPAGLTSRSVASLAITNNAVVTLQGGTPTTDHTTRTVLTAGSLSISPGSTFDLGGNDLIVHGAAQAATVYSTLTSQIRTALNPGQGYWNGTGLTSTLAAADTHFLTAIGIMLNDDGQGNPIYSPGTFDNQNTTNTDILIKYTYYGDADLNGIVNGADYAQIDNGFGIHITGWSNGDFNYDGMVDGSDYSLIDNTFNQLNATGAAPLTIATPTDVVAVPEPTALSLLALATLTAFRRRRFPK